MKTVDGFTYGPLANATSEVVLAAGSVAHAEGINVGTYNMGLTADDFLVMDGGVDVTANYTITVTDGWLEITPAQLAVTVTANSDTKVYTGSEQTVTGYEAPVGLLTGHQLSGLEASGSGTNVGNYTVTFTGTPVIMDGSVDVTENYVVSLTPGNLEITAAQLAATVTAVDATKRYDGTPLTKDEASVSGLLPGHTMSEVTVTGSQTLVGSSANVASAAKILDENNVDVTANYDITYVDGTLTVTKRPGGGGGTPSDPEEEIIEEEEIPLGPPDMLNMEDHFRYIAGYPNNTVQPEGNITREEVAAVFFRLLKPEYRDTIRTRSHNFPDVEAGRWSEKPVATLAKGKIIRGYEDGSFRPGNNITRAELAVIASRFDNLTPFTSDKFSDINNHWANRQINSAAEKGWVNGYEDGTFKPDQYIIRAEFIALVNNVLNRHVKVEDILDDAVQFPDLSKDKWYYATMQESLNSHHYTRAEGEKYEDWTEIYYPVVEM